MSTTDVTSDVYSRAVLVFLEHFLPAFKLKIRTSSLLVVSKISNGLLYVFYLSK